MTKQQKMWFGIIITVTVIIGIIVSVTFIGLDNKNSETDEVAIDLKEEETLESEIVESEIIIEEPETVEPILEEPIVEEPEEEIVIEDYIEQEDVLKQELSEEEVALRDEYAAEYVAEKSSQDIQPPFDSMLERIRQDYDAIDWEQVYLTKGNFIWWLDNEAKTKVDIEFTTGILDDKGLVNIYVVGNQEDADKVKSALDKWITSMIEASAYSETDVLFQVNYFPEN